MQILPKEHLLNRPLTSGRAELVRKKYRPQISFSIFEMMMKMMMVGFHFNALLKKFINRIIIQNGKNNKSNFKKIKLFLSLYDIYYHF